MTNYDVWVPANTSATLYLPATGEVHAPDTVAVAGTVTHNGIETTCFELPSGHWHFGIGEGGIAVSNPVAVS
jgi:hypothetical protein